MFTSIEYPASVQNEMLALAPSGKRGTAVVRDSASFTASHMFRKAGGVKIGKAC